MSILAAGLLAGAVLAGTWSLRRAGSALRAEGAAEAARAYQAFQSARYFGGLDTLRAISVLAVIWTHTTIGHTVTLLNQGHRGVDLFFAISGFLVTTLLLREYRRTGAVSMRDFYMRRTLRIFPLYFAVLAMYCVLVFAMLRGTPKAAEFWHNVPAFLTYTSNWLVSVENGGKDGVTFYFAWSLATEEQFYLLWPALMVLALRFVPRTALLVIPVTGLLLLQMAGDALKPVSFAGTMLASLAPAILFGVLLAILADDEKTFRGLYAFLGRRWVAPVLALLMVAGLAVDAPWRVVSFSMALLVACVCLREDTWLHPLLKCRPLAYIGTISYGIYLMHMLAANAMRKALGQDFGVDVFLVTIPVVIAMASASFRYFERPLLRYKTRFSHVPMRAGTPVDVLGALDVTSPLPK
jgi:peptidoglycan/LPS O-acetylase OafA/YrhL